MNMSYLPLKAAAVALALVVALLALPGPAGASHIIGTVKMSPQQAVVGQPADIQVTLRSTSGAPMAGIPVTFYLKASIGGVSGKAVLGTATTDAKGLADLNFQPRVAGDHQVIAEYKTEGESQPENSSMPISIAGSSTQLYRSTAGVHIPGLSVWVLIAVVATVWTILISIAVRIIAIARAGKDNLTPEPAHARADEGRLSPLPAGSETGS